MADLVPTAGDQEIEMNVNGDSLSGVAEEYVSGRLSVIASAHAKSAAAMMRFEVVSLPKFGRLGWNNSISGEFVYSPRQYTMPTTNHGRETDPIENMIPGCEDTCDTCPDTTLASAQQIQDVADRACAAHTTSVDKDFFKFRAVNRFGVSNWAQVTIVFNDVPKSSGTLQVIMGIGWAMMFATACGLLRVVALQAVLNPNHRWTVCGKLCGGFCAPPEESSVSGLSADDVKHDMYGADDETTNPLNTGEDDDDA